MFKKLRVLDVGCGAGILAEGLGRLGFESVLGIDPTPKCIELAEEHLSYDSDLQKRVAYRNITLEELISEKSEQTDDDNLFDLVCCSEVIEHVNNQDKFVKDCAKLVKPNGGHFFLSSIAKTPEGYFLNIALGEHVLGWLPKGTHEYDMLISHETIQESLNDVGMPVIEKTGVFLSNPITRQMKEVPYMRSNYMLMGKKV
mmetsp:Transcript_74230/g.103137  ORF Transcript_74230/g.103137 Transcript_74230/m.103137 type:complete len:200 (+) Transcript_74230:290-889(+)